MSFNAFHFKAGANLDERTYKLIRVRGGAIVTRITDAHRSAQCVAEGLDTHGIVEGCSNGHREERDATAYVINLRRFVMDR